MADLKNWVPAIKCPTLVIWGKQDKFVSGRHAQTLQNMLSDCRVEIIAECGHLPMAEHPEKFNQLLSTFITAQQG